MGVCSSQDDLWIERISKILKLNTVGEYLGYENLGPYLFIWLFLIIDVPVLSTISYFYYGGGFPIVRNPFWILAVVLLTFTVWATMRVRDRYGSKVKKLNLPKKDEKAKKEFFEIYSRKVRYFFLISGIGFYFLWLSFNFYSFLSIEGLVPFIGKFLLIIPFVYIPVGLEFASLFVGIHLSLPRKIRKFDIHPDFTDPERHGGFKPLGSLIKFSSQLYFGIIILYTMFFYSGPVFSSTPMGTTDIFFFIGAWVFGIIAYFVPLLWIHRFMVKKKEKKKRKIDKKMRDLGGENDFKSFPDGNPQNLDEMSEYVYYYLALDHVDQMNEYPFDLGMTQELLSVALIPITISLVNQFLLKGMF